MQHKVYALSQADQKFILDSFTNWTLSISELATRFNVPRDSIISFLKKEGIDAGKYKREHLEAIESAAAKDYMSGMLMKDVAKKYNICGDTVFNYMNKHGISYKNGHGRKNHFNEHFFDTIDSEAKSYYLGYLFADGSIHGISKSYSRPCSITLCIAQSDKILIENFLQCIDYSGHPIRDYIDSPESYKASGLSSISLNSIVLADGLMKHGFVGLKKDRSELPEIPSHLVGHFIRGYFDGDGCATVNTAQFTGYVGLLSNLNSMLVKTIDITSRQVSRNYDNPDVGDLCYYKKADRQLLYDLMYTNATYFLERKREAYEYRLK